MSGSSLIRRCIGEEIVRILPVLSFTGLVLYPLYACPCRFSCFVTVDPASLAVPLLVICLLVCAERVDDRHRRFLVV